MRRTVSSHLDLDISGTTNMVFSLAVAAGATLESESLVFELDGTPLEPTELTDWNRTRLHQLVSGPGRMTVDYRAVVTGTAEHAPVHDLDLITYLRPSRYCESDSLTPTARSEFAGLTGHALLTAVTDWVGDRLRYVPGSSLPTDGAEQTLLARRGVCRDYAHLVIALLRALDVPARMVAVYAPGLSPMDFHAVAEAWVDGAGGSWMPRARPRVAAWCASRPAATRPTSPSSPTTGPTSCSAAWRCSRWPTTSRPTTAASSFSSARPRAAAELSPERRSPRS